jgi:hypothetical protein
MRSLPLIEQSPEAARLAGHADNVTEPANALLALERRSGGSRTTAAFTAWLTAPSLRMFLACHT